MANPLKIELTAAQRKELETIRDHGQKAYMREKASAILKIADGATGRQVAKHGLLKPRRTATVYDWVARYRDEGIEGLKIKSGRGRKPSFSPSVPE